MNRKLIQHRIGSVLSTGWGWFAHRALRPLAAKAAVFLGRRAGLSVTSPNSVPAADWKQLALANFNAWLTDLPDDLPDAAPATMEACDLHTVLTEFVALRQEIKFQNRQQHRTLEAQQQLTRNQETLAELFRERTEEIARLEAAIQERCEKRPAEYFLDVRDALNRGLAASRKAGAQGKGFFRRPPKGIESIVEGYEMALRRFDQALSHVRIHPVETRGRPFDPKIMQAIDRRIESGTPAGIVIEELAGGFTRGAEVVRTAQVIVSDS